MSEFTLKKASLADGEELYRMLQGIGSEENGFFNPVHSASWEEYRNWLKQCVDYEQGIGQPDWMVPETQFWFYVNGNPTGVGRLRHRLTPALLNGAGHIGYALAASFRGKGYGNILLKLLLAEAQKKGISEVRIRCQSQNLPSEKIIRYNGGILDKEENGHKLFWIRP